MDFISLLFYLLSVILIGGALATVTLSHMVHAALSLILTFFTAAMLWMLLEAEFLAIALVLVYVGAVLLLFLFVVMMIERTAPAAARTGGYRLLALTVALMMLAELVAVLSASGINVHSPGAAIVGYSNTRALGEVLYTEHVLAFEAAAVVLLIAIVGAIALTLRTRATTRRQNPSAQMRVRKQDRLRLTGGREPLDPSC